MGRWKKIFKNMKLSHKLIFLYVAVFGIVCTITMAALQISFNIYDSRLYEKSVQELDFFASQTADSMDELEKLTSSIALDENIQTFLDDLSQIRWPSYEYNYQMYQLRQILLGRLLPETSIQSILYIDPHGTALTVGQALPEGTEEDKQALLAGYDAARGGYVTYGPTAKYPGLLGGRAILNRLDMSMETLGYLLVACDPAALLEKQEASLTTEYTALFVYNAEGMIYQSQEPGEAELPPAGAAQGYKIVRENGQRYFLCYLTSSRTGWTYANRFLYSDIFGSTQTVRSAVLAGFVLLFAVSVLLVRRLAQVITRPLSGLSQSMRVVETGDFRQARQMLPPDPGEDETGQLTKEFSAMLARIDALIEEDYKKQLILQESKYQMLQAQINPHFLYNTLNTLTWLIKAGRAEEASRMTVELGGVLRASLKRENFNSVAEDITLVRSYIEIQKFRYKNRAVFEVTERGCLDEWLLPHITLQPLVENAITYGVEASLTPCRVEVLVEERTDTIFMQVRDTGPGMPPERLAAVRDGTAKPNGHGIGLKNIRERLHILFGGGERFLIESELGRGTQITIEIPKRKEEPHV